MPGVFISYRREDGGGAAGRLYDRLRAHFGTQRVFRDVDTIAPGDQFDRRIEDRLARTDVLLAVIGPAWLTCTDSEGRPRLQAPRDFVRLEIATALARGIPVVPVLLGNARMPRAGDLPPDLAPLTRRQAIEIDEADFHHDASRLIAVLAPLVTANRPRWPLGRGLTLGVAAGGAAIAILLAALVPRGTDAPAPEGQGSAPTATTPSGRPASNTDVPVPAAQRLALRRQPATLSPTNVRALIIERGYYSSESNPAGTGLVRRLRAATSGGWPIVVDDMTGLMWEQGGSIRPANVGQSGAAAYVRRLNEERAGGFDDWRLPTLDEALSLMAPMVTGDYHLDPVFAARDAPFIWTTDAEEEGRRGWVVYFANGFVSPESLDFNGYVRAVRSASPPAGTSSTP